jgi:DNA topoisomerase-1
LIAKSDIHLSNKKIQAILHDDKKSAEAVNLVHVHDNQPGINRIKKGVDFIYVSGKKKIKDKLTLNRIKKLVIPPAWENVWICHLENGHLQATGIDVKKRKQYKYHSVWN